MAYILRKALLQLQPPIILIKGKTESPLGQGRMLFQMLHPLHEYWAWSAF